MPYNTSIWQQDYWNIPTERRTAHAEQSNYSVMDVLALLLGNSETDAAKLRETRRVIVGLWSRDSSSGTRQICAY